MLIRTTISLIGHVKLFIWFGTVPVSRQSRRISISDQWRGIGWIWPPPLIYVAAPNAGEMHDRSKIIHKNAACICHALQLSSRMHIERGYNDARHQGNWPDIGLYEAMTATMSNHVCQVPALRIGQYWSNCIPDGVSCASKNISGSASSLRI